MRKRNLALAIGGGVAAAVAVKMLTRDKTVEWDERVVHSEHSHFVNIEGIRIHYQEFGDPGHQPLILIHGYTSSLYVWKTVAPMFADLGFRVLAVDLPGFGYSEKPRWFDYSIPSQAHVVERFMDSVGIGRAIVIGHSYGGAVASTLALDYAERVEKLILVGAVINDDVKSHPILRLAAVPGVGEVVMPFLLGSRAFLRHRMQTTLAPASHGLISDERVRTVQRPLNAADGHHAVLATSRNWRARRIEQDAHLIDHNTLIVWGEDDRVTPIASAHKLLDSILHSRLVVLKNCGHIPQEEKSAVFVNLINEFCHDRKGRVAGVGLHEGNLVE